MIYLILFLFILWSVYYYDITGHNKEKTTVFYIIMILFILLSGLRYHIGADNIGYSYSWDFYPTFDTPDWIDGIKKFCSHSNRSRYKIGWILYVMTLKTIYNNFVILQLANAILINTAIFSIIRKYSPHLFTPILIYYCTFTFVELEFELMRETVAVSIFLLSGFDAFVRKKWFKYYIVVFIAYNFHPSAMMMFVLPLVRNISWSTKRYIYLVAIPAIVLALVGKILIGEMINLILGSDSYASNYYGTGGNNNFNYFLMYAYKPSALLALYICYKKYIKLPSFFIPVYFFSIFFLYLGGLAYTAARFTNYIIIIDFILLAEIFYGLIKRYKTIWVSVVILILINVPTIYQYSSPINIARLYPYRSILNPTPSSNQQKLEETYRHLVL